MLCPRTRIHHAPGRSFARGPFRVRAAQHPAASETSPSSIVEKVVELIKETDGGMQLGESDKAVVDELLDQLESAGKGSKPLKDPRLMGNYVVAYTSTRRSNDRGSPAGGRFRGKLGRAIFNTTGLFQSVLPGSSAPIVTNKVAFKMFGVLTGAVGLRGVVEPVGDDDDTVKVLFDPPVLSIGDSLHLRIGPSSSVQLATTYLDDHVRIGKGSRGSLFVFTRGGDSDTAQMDQVGIQGTSRTALVAFLGFFIALMLSGMALWMGGNIVMRVGAVLLMGLGAGIASVVRQGGIIRDDEQLTKAVPA